MRIKTLFSSSLVGLFCLVFSQPIAAENAVVDLAKSKSIELCQKNLQLVADKLIKNKEHGSHASWHEAQANSHLFDTFSVISYVDGDTHLTITAAPNAQGRCDISYVETIVLSATCDTARNTTFANWRFASNLHNKTMVLQDDEGKVSVYLTPQVNDAICMVTKRQTIFD